MTPTTASSPPASTAACSPPDHAGRLLVAIHQPNLFPRLSTLAKLYAADIWIVLDDVQFARRDYQHRARLAHLDAPQRTQWLSLPTHLPHGRATQIRHTRLVDPELSRRRITHLPRQLYGHSSHWPQVQAAIAPVLRVVATSPRTADVAEASTIALLDLLGWPGAIVRSSTCAVRNGRSERLADLTVAVGGEAYLCGSGGMRYLDPTPFGHAGIPVIPVLPGRGHEAWTRARTVSALTTLAQLGELELSRVLTPHRDQVRASAPAP